MNAVVRAVTKVMVSKINFLFKNHPLNLYENMLISIFYIKKNAFQNKE